MFHGLPLGPRKVRESPVGISHTVGVLALLNGGTLVVVGVHQFGGNAVNGTHTFAGADSLDEPHGRQVVLALAFDFKRNLVVGATDTAAAGFHVRLDVSHSLLKDFQRVLDFQAVGCLLHAAVDQTFR